MFQMAGRDDYYGGGGGRGGGGYGGGGYGGGGPGVSLVFSNVLGFGAFKCFGSIELPHDALRE